MKNTLLCLLNVVFSSITALSQPIVQKFNSELPITTNVVGSQRIRPGGTFKTSFPIQAEKSASLQIRLRNRISAKSLLKASLPFAAATVYGLIRQRVPNVSSENVESHSNISPYLWGAA